MHDNFDVTQSKAEKLNFAMYFINDLSDIFVIFKRVRH